MKKVLLLFLIFLLFFVFYGCTKSDTTYDNLLTNGDVSVSESKEDNTSELPGVENVNPDANTEVTDGESSENADDSYEYSVTSVSQGKVNKNESQNDVTTTSVKQQSDKVVEKVTEKKSEKETTTKSSVAKNPGEETYFYVTFKDYDGNTLKKEKVKKGASATAPEPPKKDGFVFVKWDTYYNDVKNDIVVMAVYDEITEPALIVDTVKATDKEVVVKVSSLNNPGLLALVLKIVYDEDVMTLTKVESGSSMSGYTFTAPKNKKSGCNAAWNIIEVQDKDFDGEVALLHFEIDQNAKKGEYDISVSCYDGAFDRNYEPVKFEIFDGSVNIV